MRRLIVALFVFVWLAPCVAEARPLPAVVIPCTTTAAIVAYTEYTPQAEWQTYRVTFDVRGHGRMYAHTSRIFLWHMIEVYSPSQFTHYSFDWIIPRYHIYPTEITLEGLPAPCKQNPAGLEVTNYSITPLLGKQRTADH